MGLLAIERGNTMITIRITIEFPAPVTDPDTGRVLDDINFEFAEMGFLQDWTPEGNEGVTAVVETIDPDEQARKEAQCALAAEAELLEIALTHMVSIHEGRGGDNEDDDTGARLKGLLVAVEAI